MSVWDSYGISSLSLLIMINKIIAWNVWGLNEIKQREVKKLVLVEGIKVCALIETRVKACNGDEIRKNLFNNWVFVDACYVRVYILSI